MLEAQREFYARRDRDDEDPATTLALESGNVESEQQEPMAVASIETGNVESEEHVPMAVPKVVTMDMTGN